MAEYRKKIRLSKQSTWEKFDTQDTVQDTPWNLPYRIRSRKFRRPQPVSTVIAPDGRPTTWAETAELLLATLLPGDDIEGETEVQQAVRNRAANIQGTLESIKHPEAEETEIDEIIKSQKPGKAPGPDKITGEMLKRALPVAREALAKWMTGCLKTGTFPALHKTASVAVLYKGANKDPLQPGSYRPIDLLNILGKCLERYIVKKMDLHRRNRMDPAQHGFERGRSTETAIVEVLDYIENADFKYVAGYFIDISGAFNSLW